MADLRVETADGIATVTLDRPDALNSLTVPLKEALIAAFAELASDAAVRAVILTGAGRAFCAGQDLRERLEPDAAPLDVELRERYNPLVRAIRALPQPVVAAVNGVAAGAGASLAFACDLRIAADTARFVLAFGQVGLIPDSGATWTLQRLVGPSKAMELALLPDPLSAADAERFGLVTRVVPAAELADEARALAARLAALSPERRGPDEAGPRGRGRVDVRGGARARGHAPGRGRRGTRTTPRGSPRSSRSGRRASAPDRPVPRRSTIRRGGDYAWIVRRPALADIRLLEPPRLARPTGRQLASAVLVTTITVGAATVVVALLESPAVGLVRRLARLPRPGRHRRSPFRALGRARDRDRLVPRVRRRVHGAASQPRRRRPARMAGPAAVPVRRDRRGPARGARVGAGRGGGAPGGRSRPRSSR